MKMRSLLVLALLSLLVGGLVGGYVAISRGMPSIEELKHYKTEKGSKIFADDDVLVGELKAVKGIFVRLDDIPKPLINAVIAVEDSRFWKHRGIDSIAIMRALFKDLIYVSLKEGGSTITQQLAKVVFLTPEKTIKRKLMEAALAVKIEKNLDKREILELYLNRVYFGHGAYGVEMASRAYFGKSVRNLNLAEAAVIAGLVKAPASYSPYNDLSRAKERQMTVLTRMEDEGYITRAEREQAFRQPLALESLRRGVEANSYFIEYVRKYLEGKYDEDTIYRKGLKVYTTLNRGTQSAAVAAVQSGLREIAKRRGWRGPVDHKADIDLAKEMKRREISAAVSINPRDIYSGLVLKVSDHEALIKTRGIIGKLSVKDAQWAAKVLPGKSGPPKFLKDFTLAKILKPGDIVKVGIKSMQKENVQLSLEQDPEVEGALIAMEPQTGFIRAMVGGYDFARSDFNRALYARRQPGSAFKPVVYGAAMDHGFTPASVINDEAVTYVGGPLGDWSPENADHTFYGPTRLREALTYSRNVVTVKLADAVGIDSVTDFSRKLGITADMPRDLTIALGSFSTTPLELAGVYAVLAGGGVKTRPAAIKYITDSKGRIVESSDPSPEQVISPQTAFLVTSMLEDVVKYGTGWRARSLKRPVAGKTGTSSESKDAWFVGYSPDLVAAVWVGFDDARPLGSQESGARAASPIWVSFMSQVLKSDPEEFPRPEGIVTLPIDPKTGLLARDESGLKEHFKEGTQPRQYAPTKSIWEIRDPSQLNFD